jgi:hypothetical protein
MVNVAREFYALRRCLCWLLRDVRSFVLQQPGHWARRRRITSRMHDIVAARHARGTSSGRSPGS